MAGAVSDVVTDGLEHSMERVESTITANGYDYDLCMEKLVNYAQSSAGFDTCYIVCAHSASMKQWGTSKDDMVDKLYGTADDMFPFPGTLWTSKLERLRSSNSFKGRTGSTSC